MPSLSELIQELTYWHWWIAAGVLMILEMMAPGAFFLWLGISAALLGVIVLVIPGMSWEIQLILFGIFSVAAIFLWVRFKKGRPSVSDQPTLNRRGHHYVGRTFTLEHPIENGVGKIEVDDSTWRVRGDEIEAGVRVKVVDVDGVVLIVEPVK